jgi:ATP phosphoribosyltransferase
MDPATLTNILLEGGSLAIFVVFVLYLTKQQAEERKTMLDALKDVVQSKTNDGVVNMKLGLDSLDKVNGSIRELTTQTVELTKVVAVHDASTRDRHETVIRSLDAISAQVAAGPK